MPVQCFKSGLQFNGQAQRIKNLCLTPAFFGHTPADMLPQIAEFWHVSTWYIISNRNTGKLDNTAFNRIHKGKIRHGPWKQGVFIIT